MIELLMVIMIVAILGATALPQFLDFRNEARAAVVRQLLGTMRVGMKNQIQQALLKCGSTGDPKASNPGPFNARFLGHLIENNITAYEWHSGNIICSTTAVPSLSDRYFWEMPSQDQRAVRIEYGTDDGPQGYFYKNPLHSPGAGTTDDYPLWSVDQSEIVTSGGVCEYIDANSIWLRAHWIFIRETLEIYAGTNTPGINECRF